MLRTLKKPGRKPNHLKRAQRMKINLNPVIFI
jgi:hypothetical protein